MDGDAIGGTVNLVTRRAPLDREATATLTAGYNEIVRDSIGSADFTFGGRLRDTDRLSILLSGSLRETQRGTDGVEPEYDGGFLEELDLRDYRRDRQRIGSAIALDYEISNRSHLSIRGIGNRFTDNEIRRRKRERLDKDRIEREVRSLEQVQDISSAQLSAQTLRGNRLLEYRLLWSRSEENQPGRTDSVFVQKNVLFDSNVTPDSIAPNNIRANPLNEDIGLFFFNQLTIEDRFVSEQDLVGAVDLTNSFFKNSNLSGNWKVGAKLRFKDKHRDTDVFNGQIEKIPLTDVLADFESETPFFGGRYDLGLVQDANEILRLAALFPRQKELKDDREDYGAEENTQALYGMVELNSSRLTFVGGMRFENTENTFDAFELLRDEGTLAPLRVDRAYRQLLPMVHLRYQLSSTSNLRAALTRTLARPNLSDQAPTLFQEDDQRDRGNPDLRVTKSWNFDLQVDRYFSSTGALSVGIFYKRLTDNVFDFRFEEFEDGITYQVKQPQNGGGADLFGLEAAVQRKLQMLPEPLKGLGFSFNYTWSNSSAIYPERPNAKLQGQAQHIGNFGVDYEKAGFSGHLLFNYQSNYLDAISGSRATDEIVDDHLQLDLSATCRLSQQFSLSLNIVNLTNEPFRIYQGTPDRPIEEEVYSWWATLGLRWSV